MTPQELLTERFECIAPVPNMDGIKVGEVLIAANGGKTTLITQSYVYLCGKGLHTVFFNQEISAYPANFRLMHWSEGRAVEDMPEYVKTPSGLVFKSKWLRYKGLFYTVRDDSRLWTYALDCTPATKQEYKAYIKQIG